MKATILTLVAVTAIVAGCSRTEESRQTLLGECFTFAAYAAVSPQRDPPPAPEPPAAECCLQCGKNGLPKGKVLSGDGQAVVPCPCPDSCECKQRSGARR